MELKLREHLSNHGLGSALKVGLTVSEIVGHVTACQGGFWRGAQTPALAAITQSIADMRKLLLQKIRSSKSGRLTPSVNWSQSHEEINVEADSNEMMDDMSDCKRENVGVEEVRPWQDIIDQLRAEHRETMRNFNAAKETEYLQIMSEMALKDAEISALKEKLNGNG